MKTILATLIFIISTSLMASAKGQFYFNNENINALIGLICVGEENIATIQSGGGIEDERLSVSKWNITNYGDEVIVKGICNASVSSDGAFYELDNELELEMTFYPKELSGRSGQSIAKGTVGNAEVHIVFNSQLDVHNGQVINKTIVQQIKIAPGLGGARVGVVGQFFGALLPDLFNINSRNSTMSFCNSSAKQCRKTGWKNPLRDDLFIKAMGAGWLMNFGVKKIENNLFLNAAKILDMSGTYRIPTFKCGNNESCGGTVILEASSSSVSACSKYMERVSKHMTVALCKSIINKTY